MLDLCQEPLDKIRPEDCPLCIDWASGIKTRELATNPDAKLAMLVVTPVQFRRHLAAHLEQLALFALPKDHGGEDTSKIDSNDAVIDASSNDISVTDLSADGSDSNQGIEEREEDCPLYLAAASGQIEEVQKLLEAGADANARGKNQEYALQAAALLGSYAVVKLLVEHGADVNSPAGPNGTAVRVARSRGHRNIVDLLLEAGADSNDENKEHQASTSSRQDSIEMERAAIILQRSWRQLHPETSSRRLTFADIAWLVHRSLRKEKRAPVDPDPYWPSQTTILERIWGRLFDEQGQPTRRLDQFLRGIANYLIEDYEPQRSIVISPEKMQRYYREMRLESELCDWQLIFNDETSSISRLYREFGIEHHLIQDKLDKRPDIPALTTRGFSKWMTVLLQSFPREELDRLSRLLLKLPVVNADDRKERFPKEISMRLFPKTPNFNLREQLRHAINIHCSLDVNINTGAWGQTRQGQQFTCVSAAKYCYCLVLIVQSELRYSAQIS